MKNPLVYIIILNWNGFKDTIECINSLKKINYNNYKILLIDNASSNESVKILKSKFPKIKLIVNKNNLGFSGGCNVGIKYALEDNADYVLLLNNDTYVDKNFLSELIKVSTLNKNIGVISPFIYYADNPKEIWSSGSFLNRNNTWPFRDDNQHKQDIGQYKKLRYVEFITGCSMLIKRKVFDTIGFYNDEYFLYFEDMDFCIRARKKGFKLCTVPQSKVWHKIGQSSKNKEKLYIRYYFIRNIILFYRYNFSFIDRSIFFLIYIKESIYQISQLIVKREYRMIKAILIGLTHGFTGKTGHYSI
jgi:GT2 family glycosyltransferase